LSRKIVISRRRVILGLGRDSVTSVYRPKHGSGRESRHGSPRGNAQIAGHKGRPGIRDRRASEHGERASRAKAGIGRGVRRCWHQQQRQRQRHGG